MLQIYISPLIHSFLKPYYLLQQKTQQMFLCTSWFAMEAVKPTWAKITFSRNPILKGLFRNTLNFLILHSHTLKLASRHNQLIMRCKDWNGSVLHKTTHNPTHIYPHIRPSLVREAYMCFLFLLLDQRIIKVTMVKNWKVNKYFLDIFIFWGRTKQNKNFHWWFIFLFWKPMEWMKSLKIYI